ncbi:MAG: Bifunctional glutamine synthetase adenylyltransferase/adenylyl-removing enzyme [Burkholderiaceae bacterium]|nr:Bifunctional glutamine synthetase adenylyltransferase/adenylyl-removing enzyme [Burkholderiaceae bacterium]
MNPTAAPSAATATADYSRYVQRVRRRFGDEIAALAPGVPDADSIARLVDRFVDDGRTLGSALRIARQAVLERLVVLDVEQAAPLQAVTSTMTALAEVALDRALAQALSDDEAIHGAPLDDAGQRIDFWIVGMGKLGARELNVSSDIDLVYLYGDEGHAASGSSAHETFARIAKRLHALIGEVTDDGFVFRVDLALRPNGNSGPPVASLGALETYFQVQGREWERFAWLKSRVIAPRAAVLDGRARALGALVTPFVYRRYLDYGVFEGLRQLHRKIREEAQRRAAGRPERANDIKLSRGGIREIEFIVQLLLVVRGGQFPEIRTRSTLRGLQRLVAHGLMPDETATRLADAYTLLRRLEHRIQYLDDQQTHVLPTDDADLGWIARSMGHVGDDAACRLLDDLGAAREFVANEFDALLHDGQAPTQAKGGCKSCGTPLPIDAAGLQALLPAALAQRVGDWAAQPRVQSLRDETKLRLGRLVLRAAACVADGTCTEEATLRFVDWLEPLLRRESYVALLGERPEVLRRLLRLLGLARWPMQYLMRHPGVIDELADPRLLHERFDRTALIADLEERHAGWERSGQADEGALLDTLRHAHHAEVFRTLVRDVEGLLTVEQVADDLSALADALIDCTLRWAWGRLKNRHREVPRLAVIAYGKLGGKELGYGSDLDVVFLYDDGDEPDPDRAQEVYGAFVRKLITWLTLRTAAGQLFDIDTALRPNGNSGLLSTSIASFERYQQGRGSNTAWTWEHQALTRARFCAGCTDLAPRFDAARAQVLATARDHEALAAQVVAMRERVRAAHPVNPGKFDVKHSPGGMMDAEFAVQYLVLAHAHRYADLIDNVGNIALLQRAELHGMLPAGVGQAAAHAYRELRRAQHRARLDERPTQFEPSELAAEHDAVAALWHAVFGRGSTS